MAFQNSLDGIFDKPIRKPGQSINLIILFLEKCGDYNQTESVAYYQSATLSPDDYSYYETITSDGGISVSTNDDAQGILLVLKVSYFVSIEILNSC